jgi:polar amino acid transport system substrate-binding protein
MSYSKLTCILVALYFIVISTATFAEVITLGLAQNEAVQDVAAKLLTEIYRRAGLTSRIEPLPPARITQMVLNDQLDGEVARIGPYFSKNPSLFKVEPSYYYLVTTAFAKTGRNIKINSTQDLKKYRVGIIRGVYHAALATEGVAELEVTDSVTQLFRMLELDRIDIAVDVGINGQDIISQLGLKNIRPIAAIARHDFFNVLIKSKSELAPKISAVIKSMKSSGELDKLIRSAEQKRLGSGPVLPGIK